MNPQGFWSRSSALGIKGSRAEPMLPSLVEEFKTLGRRDVAGVGDTWVGRELKALFQGVVTPS